MQPYEIAVMFNNIKAAVKQCDTGLLTDRALAILTLGCILDDRLSEIDRSLEGLRTPS